MNFPPTLLFAIGAGVVGAMVDSGRGFLVGLALGALWGSLHALSTRLDMLEGAFRDLTARLDALDAFARQPARTTAPPEPRPQVPAAPPPLPVQPRPVPPEPRIAAAPPSPPATGGELPAPRTLEQLRAADRAAAAHPAASPEPGGFGSAVAALVEFCTTGNVVAKLGVVILFFGVAFLVRFAAEAGLLPIEYRLMGVTAGAMVMLAVGWRLRRSRPDFAMAVQGGAVGILYLTIFAAFRLYDLLPAAAALALMLVVVGLSGALAVLQNQVSLAVLGTTGGFLAPILASTGSGSHVSLFS